MSEIKRTIAGLARLSQRGSIQSARLGCQIISGQRFTATNYPDVTSAVSDKAAVNRGRSLASDATADYSAQTPDFRS